MSAKLTGYIAAASSLRGGVTNGMDGRTVEIRVSGDMLQKRYIGDAAWSDIYDLSTLAGADGREIELSIINDNTDVAWRYVGGTTWTVLYALSLTTGPKGDKGDQGAQGEIGPQGEIGMTGPQGEQGVGLQFNWSGTQLGVKREDAPSYTYKELKGEKGEKGDPGEDSEATAADRAAISDMLSGVSTYFTAGSIDYGSLLDDPTITSDWGNIA